MELKIISISISNSVVEEKIGKNDVKLQVKIFNSEVCCVSTPFMNVKTTNNGISCKLLQSYKIRVDTEICEFMTIALYAIIKQSNTFPSGVQSLKQPILLGYSKININDMRDANPDQTYSILMNNEEYKKDEPIMYTAFPKLTVSMQLHEEVIVFLS